MLHGDLWNKVLAWPLLPRASVSSITTIASDQKLWNVFGFFKVCLLYTSEWCKTIQIKVNLFAEPPGKCCFVMSNGNLENYEWGTTWIQLCVVQLLLCDGGKQEERMRYWEHQHPDSALNPLKNCKQPWNSMWYVRYVNTYLGDAMYLKAFKQETIPGAETFPLTYLIAYGSN